jgi:NAD(P)H-nitrite reductase large subunit
MIAALHWRRVPLFYGRAIGQVVREDGALAVQLVCADGRNSEAVRLNVDAVCLGYGFHPDNELLRLLGCGHDYDPQRDQLVTRRDADCRTTVAGIFAVGDCAQTNGAAVAAAEGVIAGLAAARDCGLTGEERIERAARRELLRHRRFQSALWSLFAPAGNFAVPTTPDTVVCRCEHVTSAMLDAAIEAGCTSLGAVKRKTRLGMGPCQGRYCVPVALSRLARHGGQVPGDFDRAAPRPPLRPLRLRELGAGRTDV